MKTTTPVLSVAAFAISLLLAQPGFANEEELSEEEAQNYARELLKSEEERAGLDNIREEPSERYLEEKEENRMEGHPGEVPEEDY
ncbi:hypothetical protein [Halopseudomonas sp.]|jgi:hypothetical protein|uniref:hypothetical protein n=1 Tax=Halopseudomonas sp. TaxID=2901191 RepID=UPI001A530F0E|nr:hypothetical protein [Pseudomonas sp.]|tara:strand:+ start:11493 stop:11747 length:255 start_codon:yes stop_codon:yes gene_type:complete